MHGWAEAKDDRNEDGEVVELVHPWIIAKTLRFRLESPHYVATRRRTIAR